MMSNVWSAIGLGSHGGPPPPPSPLPSSALAFDPDLPLTGKLRVRASTLPAADASSVPYQPAASPPAAQQQLHGSSAMHVAAASVQALVLWALRAGELQQGGPGGGARVCVWGGEAPS